MEDTKLCNYCHIVKSSDNFQRYRLKCRSCRTLETREWNSKNRKHHNEYQRKYKAARYNQDKDFKIKAILRSRLRKALKNDWKVGSAISNLGCSIQELRTHLESKFQSGMSWENWGTFGWHIDHIIPLDSFDLSKPEELAKACNYTNLQPLWHTDNSAKSNKVK